MQATGQQILVIDDDPDIGIMLKLMFEYKGLTAAVANSAEVAEQMLQEARFQLIVMDMLLSGTNGTDLCSKLRKDQHTKQIPILMISAHPNARDICIKAGADDFILKPFDMHEILTKVNTLMQATPEGR